MERLATSEVLGIFNEGMIGSFAYCSGNCVFLTKTFCAKTEKKEFENDRFVSMFKRHALKIKSQKTRQDKIYFESARHITINISSRALLNRLFENNCIQSTCVQQLQKNNSL